MGVTTGRPVCWDTPIAPLALEIQALQQEGRGATYSNDGAADGLQIVGQALGRLKRAAERFSIAAPEADEGGDDLDALRRVVVPEGERLSAVGGLDETDAAAPGIHRALAGVAQVGPAGRVHAALDEADLLHRLAVDTQTLDVDPGALAQNFARALLDVDAVGLGGCLGRRLGLVLEQLDSRVLVGGIIEPVDALRERGEVVLHCVAMRLCPRLLDA